MNTLEVIEVEEFRATSRKGQRLEVVPNSHQYRVRIRLEDGREATLLGPGEPPVESGEILSRTAR
jgi:hypothetical protein